jgi:hypothetical protein
MKNKFDQFKMLKSGCEIVVCTPGRLIDLIKMKATNMRRVTFLVLDEADRMFDMGYASCSDRIALHPPGMRHVLEFRSLLACDDPCALIESRSHSIIRLPHSLFCLYILSLLGFLSALPFRFSVQFWPSNRVDHRTNSSGSSNSLVFGHDEEKSGTVGTRHFR